MGKDEDRHHQSEAIIQHFTKMTASTSWQCVKKIRLAFQTGHPQGLVKIGNSFYLSSVEIGVSTEKFLLPQNGYDRTPGEGIGRLFHFDSTGDLLQEMALGEGPVYHPGGIDYDGASLWVPVAEYRPNSQSIIYRVTPETLDVHEMFRCQEHVGGLAYNRRNDTLYGIGWGGRTMYVWTPVKGKVWKDGQKEPHRTTHINGSHYIDYQDCQFLGEKYMLCSGLSSYALPNVGSLALGGVELVDLELHIALHQVPVILYSNTMRPMTQNPFFVELHQGLLRFYFVPDDHESTLYVYDVVR